MPRIPQASSQVSTAASPNAQITARATPDTFGASVGRGLQDIGRVAEAVARNDRATKLASLKAQSARELNEFTFRLENDQDFDTHFDRYQEKVRSISSQIQETTKDERLFQAWQSEFAPVVQQKSFSVRRNALKGIISHQKADLETNLETFASLSGSDDPVQNEFAQSSGMAAIEQAVANGVLWPEEGQRRAARFRQDITQAEIRRDLALDPEATEQRLLDGKYDSISGEQRQIWLERASNRAEAEMRKRNAAEDREHRLREREQREREEIASKEGDKLVAGQEMTAEWIEANRENLSQADYRYFYKSLDGDMGRTDPIIYSELRMRAGQGEDVRGEARSQLHSGAIKLGDYDRLLSLVESNSASGQISSWYKRGESFIARSLKPSDLNYDPAAAQRHAQAMDDWYEWARQNPESTATQAREEQRRIVEEYAIIDFQEMTLIKRAPSYLVGTRNAPDLDATETATVEAFERGEIDRSEFFRQAALLEEWRYAIQKMNERISETTR